MDAEFDTVCGVRVLRHPALPSGALRGAAGGGGDRTGLMLWPGARALCRALAASPPAPRQHVIELGAGCGLCSAFAARYAPAAVAATDGDAACLPLAEATWRANVTEAAPAFCARVFRWDAGYAAAAAELVAHLRQKSGGDAVGALLLLASEVVYPSTTRDSLAHLFLACRALLAAYTSAALLMSYVPRAPRTDLALLDAAAAAGLAFALSGSGGGGDECGAVVLRFTLASAPLGAEALEAGIRAVFPDARAAVARQQQLAEEAEAEQASGGWGAPPPPSD